jgi:hypothetical protein
MGYDFMFEKAQDASSISFPCEYGEFEMETSTFPWKILKEYLIASGARANMGENSLVWEIEDQGTIYITGTDSYASLDMHAEWPALLSLFVWLREKDPNVVLADVNEGFYYDPASFQDFMKSLNG